MTGPDHRPSPIPTARNDTMSDTDTVVADRKTEETTDDEPKKIVEEKVSSSVERPTRSMGFVRRLRSVRGALLPVLGLVAVVALAVAAILGWQLRQERAVDDAAAAALEAARAYAVTLTSVDSGSLDSDFAAVLDGSTGEFRDMYTRSSGQLRELLQENKATGKGAVLESAVKSATETEVEVLLFIDQTVTNAAATDPRVDRSRVLMTMQLVDGRWLASRVYLP
ncbi:hypothetical protein ACFWPX_30630 [Nocardia sp. NPDC058518]|uniref:hypothetical protein n=1 Tax=Nocardia sp. NPDC058518 TaxID=3346534 RepID=UPI003659158A